MQPLKKIYIINAIAVIALFFVLFMMIQTGTINRYISGILVVICINIVLAVSLNIVTGELGQIALGHAGFMAVGAYTAALVSKLFPEPGIVVFLLALVTGGLGAALIGFLIGLPALRLRGDYLAIITIAFAEIIRVVITNMKITGGAQGLRGIEHLTTFTTAFWVMVLVIVFSFTLKRSRHGRAILSIREDEIAAAASGINVTYYKTLAFVVSAFFAGIAGGMYAHHIGILGAKTFGFMKSVEILVYVVLGGMGSFTGSIVAAGLLTALPEFLRMFASYRMLFYSILLIAMMIFRPKGIFGRYEFSLYGFFRNIKIRWTNHFGGRGK